MNPCLHWRLLDKVTLLGAEICLGALTNSIVIPSLIVSKTQRSCVIFSQFFQNKLNLAPTLQLLLKWILSITNPFPEKPELMFPSWMALTR